MCQSIVIFSAGFNILVALTKNPITVSEYYPFSDVDLNVFKAERRFNSLLKQYNFLKMQYERGLYGSAVTVGSLASYKLHAKILYWQMCESNETRTLLWVPNWAVL